MKRTIQAISSLLLLVAALLAPGGSATGAPPTPVDTTETFAAGAACPFPIEVVSSGKSLFADLPNNPQYFGVQASPTLRITVTNLSDTSKSVTVNATGAFRFVDVPGDNNFKVVAGGHNVLYGVPGVGATALATTGPIEVLAENGQIADMDLSGAQVRDLCAELA